MNNVTNYPFEVTDEEMLEDLAKRIVDFILNTALTAITKEIYSIDAEYHLDIVDSKFK